MESTNKLCELCNTISMIFLKKDKFDISLEFLKKAEILTQKSQKFKSLTLNNLATFYRKQNKLKSALKYLETALKVEIEQGG